MKFAPTFKKWVDGRVAIWDNIAIAKWLCVKRGVLEGCRKENIFLFYRAQQFQT